MTDEIHNVIGKLTVRQMQIFLAVMESRSFALAAEAMQLSPPAVSMQMKTLSDLFGTQLFKKTGRQIEPTASAISILPFANQMVENMHNAYRITNSLEKEREALVRVGMVTTSRSFGPMFVHNFKEQNPNIKLEISIDNRKTIISKLEEGVIDIALMGRPPKRIDVTYESFAKHPYVLIANPSHPLTKFKRIARSDLVAHRFFVREEGSGTRMVHDHFFTDAGLELPRSQVMESNENIKNTVMAQLGLAFISAHTVAFELELGRLSVLDVKGMPELREWLVVHPKGTDLSPAVRSFKEFTLSRGSKIMQGLFGPNFGAT